MYSVYLDESGQETGEHVVLVGYLGSEEQWTAFDLEWKLALGTTRNFHISYGEAPLGERQYPEGA